MSNRGKQNKAKDKYPTKSSRGGCPLINEKINARAMKAYEENIANIRASHKNADVPEYVPPIITRADTWLGNWERDDGTYTSDTVREITGLIVSK